MLVSFRVYGHVPGVAGLTRVRHPSGMSGAELAQYLRNRFGPGMFLANLVGAIDVFVLLVWILPTPGVPPGGLVARNAIAFAVFLTFCLTAGAPGFSSAPRPVPRCVPSGGGRAGVPRAAGGGGPAHAGAPPRSAPAPRPPHLSARRAVAARAGLLHR